MAELTSDPQLRLVDLDKTYPGGHHALRGVSLDVADGEVVVIIGPSGCGKSTLLRTINGLEPINSGQILFDGNDLAAPGVSWPEVRRRIGMVFQSYELFPHLTVMGNLTLAPGLVAGESRADASERALKLLERVGLADRADDYPRQLSGGQRQRVGIARALADEPAVLLCDEPTSALDTESTAQILALLRRVRDVAGVTVVIITHEMAVVREICDSVTLLGHGQVLQTGSLEEVVADPATPLARELVPMPVVDTADVPADAGSGVVLLDVVFTSHPGVPTGATVLHLASSMGADVTAGTFESLGSVQVGRLALTVPAYHADKIIEQLRKNNVHAEVRDQ